MEIQKYELKNNKSMNLKQQKYKGEQQKYELKPKKYGNNNYLHVK